MAVHGRLAGKVAIVTGAGSAGPGWGVGKAIAVAMSREGAAVGLVDLNVAAAEETAEVIRSEGGTCSVLPKCDVSKAEDVQAMLEACEAALGPITTLVNNVGLVCPGDVVSVPLEKWEFINLINLSGVFNCSKACLTSSLKRGAPPLSIVNISSVSSLRALRSEVSYAASKAAVNALTMALARELADRSIRVNSIAPGLLETPLVLNTLRDKSPEEIAEAMAARHALSPTGKMGDAWDIAHACVYLASEEATYANGITMAVDGGLTQQVLAQPSGMPLLRPFAERPVLDSARRLSGKVAILTGTDFCSAVAKVFVEHGASVLLACRDAAEICAEIDSDCAAAAAEDCDLSTAEGVEALVTRCVERFGGINLLVNGPGVECDVRVEDLDVAQFQRVYQRNANSVLYTMRFAIPQMLKRGGGSIVNMPSMAGQRYTRPQCAVSAAAGSVSALTLQTAAEFATQGVRCNGLVPFVLDASVGMRGYAFDIANAALYLCSDEARYVSGQIINVDLSQASRVNVKME